MPGGGFQTSVQTQPAPAVAGDFASANPRFSFDAGPGGLVAGPNGLVIGVFAWVAQYPLDPNGTGQQANNTGTGLPSGFVHREQQGLIVQYLDNAEMSVPVGFGVTLMTGGDFWCKNDGTSIALPGNKAYASLATGRVRFGATGSATQGATSSASSIAAATGTCTATIAGNIMTVTGTTAGTVLVVGATLAGNAGTAGGDHGQCHMGRADGGRLPHGHLCRGSKTHRLGCCGEHLHHGTRNRHWRRGYLRCGSHANHVQFNHSERE